MAEQNPPRDEHGSWNLGGQSFMTYADFLAQERDRQRRDAERLRKQESARADAEVEQVAFAEPEPKASPAPVAAATVAMASGAAAAAADRPAPRVSVPVENELTDHNYDGIQEYDNPMPAWWSWIFVGTIAWSIAYVAWYHVNPFMPTLSQRHNIAEAKALDKQFGELREIPLSDDKLLMIMQEDYWLSQGAAIFSSTCAICHGSQGQGLVGPNLTDDLYKNIASLTDIVAIIRDGVGDGAMPPQANALNPSEIELVAAYTASMRGRNLPTPATVNPALTGEPIEPWPTPAGSTPEPTPPAQQGDAPADTQAAARSTGNTRS